MATGPVGGTYPAVVVVHDLQHPRQGRQHAVPLRHRARHLDVLVGPGLGVVERGDRHHSRARGRVRCNRELPVVTEERNRSRRPRARVAHATVARPAAETCSEDGDNRRRIDVTLTDSLDGPVNVALTSGSSCRSPRLVVGLSLRTHSVSVRRRRSSASPPPDPPRRHRWPPTSPRPSSPAR